MKKVCISFLIISIIILGLTAFYQPKTQTEYLRIHIRADSNSSEAQAVKYKVKDAVTSFLTPYVSECETKKEAEKMLTSLLGKIEEVTDRVLLSNGFSYKSKARLAEEEFPTRKYEDFILEHGYYDALIIELGSGRGDNWWCVVYPPLCFTSGDGNVIYKSKILEIINAFKKR